MKNKYYIPLAILIFTFLWIAKLDAGEPRTVEKLGIKFQVPEGFVVGKFKKEELPPSIHIEGYKSPFQNATVLVEPNQLRKFSAEAIPVGEIPVIWLDRLTGSKARFMKSMLKEGFKKNIGRQVVYQLPGFPGPYGDAMFYTLIPVAGGDILEIGGHRLYFRDGHPKSGEASKTGYDRTIEQIIRTLKFLP